MISLVTTGAAAGLAIYLLIVTIAPPRDSALTQLGQLDALYSQVGERVLPETTTPGRGGLEARLGAWVARETQRRGIRYTSLRQDLALTARTLDWMVGRKVLYGVGTFVLMLALLVGAQVVVGGGISPLVALVLAVVAGAAMFFVPDVEARATATRRRSEFRHALSAYEDWVRLEMAGSAAAAEALPTAAAGVNAWPFVAIRQTLYRAKHAGQDQWMALSDLGVRLGVPELRDLGQLIHLVAHDGAQVRATLAARSATLRRAELAEMTGEAGKRDSSMRLAQIVIGLGFMLFAIYPAFVNVMNF